MSTVVKKLKFYVPAEEIFKMFYQEPMAVFLDSSLQNSLGKYSIIGICPFLIIEERRQCLYVNGEKSAETLEEFMTKYLYKNREENRTTLPIISGAIGYFSYEYGRKAEAIPSRHIPDFFIPEALFCFYQHFIIEDLEEKVIYISTREKEGKEKKEVEQLEKRIKRASFEKGVANPSNSVKSEVKSDFTKKQYKEAVNKMKDYIIEGDIYIANMTRRLLVKSTKPPYEVFQSLRLDSPAPFGGYANYVNFQVICSSPERFIKIEKGKVETRPIKGTRRRGETPEEDERLKRELLESDKDKSELLMIVDLERNDLNRVCQPGSVKVTEHFKIEEYATVFHLVSTVVGELKEECSHLDLLQAALPGGSITGAPKIRAMEIIDELEKSERGLYTGCMGYFSLDGCCDFNIVIRTALHQDGLYLMGTGGGITCESDPEFEFEETRQKAKALINAITK
ncbi:aminodeoxychorismate synthase component I [Anaeromicropila populeti]|uniref:Anthranilate synthase component 1 n=1 Tax=Anaeromicropila populeti TaxID=37658 RepID=A0A1I6JWF2_9FIRM|nr:aminodeoxychorismate synthase component I [Anaeromicropila populeti]SFR83319.1 aminodeoxychorismate synthase, subunit I [Anaeromicropila populeti]